MTPPHFTLLFAGLCALMQWALTLLVIARRVQTGVKVQDGGDAQLLQRIRAHGNFAETVPFALVLLLLLELRGLGAVWLIGLGVGLVLGRLLHALSALGNGAMWSRLGGMALTLAVLSVEGVLCLWLFLR